MPCFNDGDEIEKAIDSIRDQDLPNIEIIVVNDGSTDDSKKVIDGLKEAGLIDKVIHFEENKGACVARNEGAKIAEGKYLSFLPADAILYPGMARIWYTNLEEHPDYDFLYGGYRIIDKNGEPVPGHEFFFEPFDPYLLESSNYIDGSFPIRTTSFWKYAKIMNQPDGLWDPNIKSLQDWDFWLSVVKNGGKGIYVQDIFFGTTMPHKGGLSDDSSNNWVERTKTIKAKHGIPDRKVCVASLGAGFHAKRVAYLLGADFKEMPSFKPHEYETIYVIGFYPEHAKNQDSMFLNSIHNPQAGRTTAKKVIHFVGSDIWQLFHIPYIHLKNVWRPYFESAVDEVLAEDAFTQSELMELGIKSKVVPLPPLKLFEPRPLPDKFTVACYMPGVNRDFYRPNEMIEIAKRMPDVHFKFFGNPAQIGTDPLLPKNIEYAGYVTDMDKFISECSAIMRFPIHDGLPISVLEFLLAGRYSIQSVPVMHTLCLQNFTIEDAIKGINVLKEDSKKGLNQIAIDHWRKELDHDVYRERMKEFLDYNPKAYWEQRADSWTQQANFSLSNPEKNSEWKKDFEDSLEKIKPIFDKIGAKSVLDIGCGDGRFVPILTEWGITDYTGIDISENLIRIAQTRFPHLKDRFFPLKIEDFKGLEKKDVVFSYTCLQHVKDEDIGRAVEAIKASAKKAIIIEPHGFKSRFYSRNHDYEKLFKVIETVEIGNKKLYLCDLE